MAVGVTSLIVVPYKREHTINDGATVKNREAVFTHSSPRSSAPGGDRGTPVAIGSTGPTAAVTRPRTTAGHLKRTYLYVLVPSRAILPTYMCRRRSLSS